MNPPYDPGHEDADHRSPYRHLAPGEPQPSGFDPDVQISDFNASTAA
jgi:hypothetical protein